MEFILESLFKKNKQPIARRGHSVYVYNSMLQKKVQKRTQNIQATITIGV